MEPLERKIGVYRPPEPTRKEMTLSELTEARRKESGRQSSGESDRLLRQATGVSENNMAPRPPEESPLRNVVDRQAGTRTQVRDLSEMEKVDFHGPREKKV